MSWICDFLQFFNCQGFLEANTELLVEVSKPQREFVVEKQVAKDNFLVRKVETQRSHSTNEGSDKSRNHSGSSDGSFAFFLQAAADWEMEDDGLPKRDKEAEERARRALEEEEKRLDRRCAQNAARAEAERRRTALEMLEGERAVARFLKQHGFEGVNCPKKNMLGRYQYPLHKASELGNARLIRMLLREGAIPQNLDSSGRTALVVAERRNRNGSHMKVIQSLTCPSAAASPNDRYLL